METVIDWDQCVAKLVALGSDGAAVMLGKNSGVITLLQAQQPSMIAVHCSGHRLELAYKDSVKNFPLAEKVVTLLTGLYYMYRNSPLNRTNLKNAYRCLGHKVLLPTRAGGTRWVGHVLQALNNFLSGYAAFRLHLEQVSFYKIILLTIKSSNSLTVHKTNCLIFQLLYHFSWLPPKNKVIASQKPLHSLN